MLSCVNTARSQRKLAKSKVWARAAELYEAKYIENCAVAEEERLAALREQRGTVGEAQHVGLAPGSSSTALSTDLAGVAKETI